MQQDPQTGQVIATQVPVVIDGVSIFFGILAGALVQYALDWIRSIVRNRKHLAAVRFEMNYVLGRVVRWRALAGDFRNAVNGDTPQNATQYFDFSKVPLTASVGLINSGRAYNLLADADLPKLLDVVSFLTPAWENVVSGEIMKVRTEFDKPYAVRQANWLDGRLTELHDAATVVLRRLTT